MKDRAGTCIQKAGRATPCTTSSHTYLLFVPFFSPGSFCAAEWRLPSPPQQLFALEALQVVSEINSDLNLPLPPLGGPAGAAGSSNRTRGVSAMAVSTAGRDPAVDIARLREELRTTEAERDDSRWVSDNENCDRNFTEQFDSLLQKIN